MRGYLCALTLPALVVSATTLNAADSKAIRGFEIAKAHCSRCHIVDETNRFAGISSTPSFKSLVTALSDWQDRFETFYARNPHPSVVHIEGLSNGSATAAGIKAVALTPSDVEALLVYIRKYQSEISKTE